MRKKISLLLICVFLILGINAQNVIKSRGVPSIPTEIECKQPDGSIIKVLQHGDAVFHWHSTSDGYTIIKNPNGYFEYATSNSTGDLISSGIRVQTSNIQSTSAQNFLKTAKKNVFYSQSQVNADVSNSSLVSTSSVSKSFPASGTRKLLVILVNFSNTTTTFTQADFNTYADNFRSYYSENSYGTLILNSTVTAWVRLSTNHDYYGPRTNWRQFAYDAIRAADAAGVDFSQFDNDGDGIVDGIAIIHQGTGQESSANVNDIWSHSGDLSFAYSASQRTFDGVKVDRYTAQPELYTIGKISSIGVLCHEFGHNLGVPDFYDTNYDTNGQYDGTGYWDLMASGCWSGYPQGSRPAHHNIWSKTFLGWQSPTKITTANTYTLRNSEQYKEAYRIETTSSNEYFLLENRQLVGYDNSLPGHGLIIYHVDGNYISSHMVSDDINTTSHQGLHPEPANGTINAASCLFPSNSNKTQFTDNTTPNALSWAGNNTNCPITNITETNSQISFHALYSAPTTQTSNIVVTNITTTSATISWTGGNGSNRVVFVENPAGTAAAPYNNTTYTASTDWNAKGTRIGTSNYYCVYNGSGNSVTLTNLPLNSRFAVRISEYNGSAGREQYLTKIVTGNPISFYTLAIPPTTQASSIVVTNITTTSATISWTKGNGAKRVVFAENPSAIAAAPYNNTTYKASTDWNTKGSRIGTSNYYCVYNGSGNSVSLTNLPSSSDIAIRISEYNGLAGNEQYLTTIVTDNPISFTTLAPTLKSAEETSDIKQASVVNSSVSVSPNPTSGLITVKSTKEDGVSMNISIRNMYGNVVYQVTIYQNSIDVDLTGVASGIYIVKVDIGGTTTVHKVIRN